MKDHLIFDTTSAQTISDTDSVGAFVRANDGSLITKHSLSEAIKASLISQGLVFKSKLAGAIGNTYSFTVIDSGGAGPLSFTEVGGDIILDLVGLTPTTAQVVTALSGNTYVDVTAGIPAGNVIVAAQQDLTGGEDTNLHKYLDVYSATADGFGNPITSSNGALNVNIASGVNVEVDLSHLDDSVRLGDGSAFFTSTSENSDIALDVHISNTEIAVTQGSDSPWAVEGTVELGATTLLALETISLNEDHNYGAVGATTLRTAAQIGNATGAADFDSGASGAQTLRVTIATDDVIVTSDVALAATSLAAFAETGAAATVSKNAVASPLANRKYLWLYNNDNLKMFIGGSGVTVTNGFPISPGSYMELRAGAAVDVEFVSTKPSHLIRTLEAN